MPPDLESSVRAMERASHLEASSGRGKMGFMRRSRPIPAGTAKPMSVAEAARRQKAYAAHRRDWAEAVGRPYRGDEDPRPPPGEVDASPEE